MKNKIMHEIFHKYISDFYQKKKIVQIKLVYEGEVTHKTTKDFIALIESKMTSDSESIGLKKKVIHIIVESLQNISKHAQNIKQHREDFNGIGSFSIAKSETYYYIIAGNPIHIEEKQEIEDLIKKLNSLNKESLNKLHKEQMREGKLSEKGGAGLGLMEIVRKSGKPLTYDFKKISDDIDFFILTTQIPRT